MSCKRSDEIPDDKLFIVFTTGDGKKRAVRYSFYQEFRDYIELIFANVQTTTHVPADAVTIEELPNLPGRKTCDDIVRGFFGELIEQTNGKDEKKK